MNDSERRHLRRAPVFASSGPYDAWIAATQSGSGAKASSRCAISVVEVSTGVVHMSFFPSSNVPSTHYRGLVAAVRGVIEAVPAGSSVSVVTNSEAIAKAYANRAGRKEQIDLWERLDTLLDETGTKLEVIFSKDDPKVGKLKAELKA